MSTSLFKAPQVQRWVYKLGGGTVVDAARIRHSLSCIPARPGTVLIVSAPAGVTDQLCAVDAARCQGQQREARALLHQVVKRFADLAQDLLSSASAQAWVAQWENWTRVHGLQASRARLLARGELWNAQLIAQYLCEQGCPARSLDARRFIVAEAEGAEAEVNQLAYYLPSPREIAVITGFIARDAQGEDHTLGRDGSDYTAALVAEALVNEGLAPVDPDQGPGLALFFLTDTPGIRSADPRRLNHGGQRIPCIGHREARTLVHWGGGVLHQRTIKPLARAQIRAWVGQPGGVLESGEGESPGASQGQGTWLIPGNHWPAGGLGIFVAGAANKSERHVASTARLVLPAPLYGQPLNEAQQLENGHIQEQLVQACRQRWPGSDAYGAGVEIAPSSACEEQDENALNVLLRQVHQRFYESVRRLRVVLLGPGLVGRELLRQLHQVDLLWRLEYGIAVEVSQIVNSKGTLALADPAQGPWYEPECGLILRRDEPALVLIDTTASPIVAARHRSWLDQGAAVVTANKHALSAELELAQSLLRHPAYAASTTVGAGLPFIAQLQRWQGPKIIGFEAILSGSANYLLSQLEHGCSYAQALAQAQQLGLLEPDPRADLEGWDSLRKLLILARALGLPARVEQIQHQPLLSQANPAVLQELLNQARAQGACLRYVASWDGSTLSLAPRIVERHSPLAVTGCENLLRIQTSAGQCHSISGPGAGPLVTAQGLLRDLLAIGLNQFQAQPESRAA